MLGSVRPVLDRLSEEDRQKYRAYYCGLCEVLGKRYGTLSRMLLNYDLVFIALCYDSLSGTDCSFVNKGCIANPIKKKDICLPTPGLEYASDVLTMLAYFKVLDDIEDEKPPKKLAYASRKPFLKGRFARAEKRWPLLAQVIRTESLSQKGRETPDASLDSVAMPTERMTQTILECCTEDEEKARTLGRFGFFLGRVIYLLDALVDMEDDLKEGRYNYFVINGISSDEARSECYMALGELAHWYDSVGFGINAPILDNIIYLGLYRDIYRTQVKEENGREIQTAGTGTGTERGEDQGDLREAPEDVRS
ncbi:MAG: hypothetical protein IJG64_01295 [Oscillospiraceae bacterium]|nr:hypothetical protein [Oscillospiraceae bacterium]